MGWFIAVILALFLLSARRELQALRSKQAPPSAGTVAGTGLAGAQQNLIILRLELQRLLARGEIDADRYQSLTEQIDAEWAAGLEAAWLTDNLWRQCCEAAWRQLAAQGRLPAGPPPWQKGTPQLALELVPPVSPAPPEKIRPIVPEVPSTVPPLAPAPTLPVTQAESAAEPGYAWQPQEPSALEKALRAVSGWPRAVLPFLVQNIGWFIGAFCFLAGSIFLVSYTSGFIKGFLVFATLFTYTLLLLWAGYQLRLKQPELKTGSAVLMTLGMLLVPLNFSAVALLLVYSGDSGWLMAVSLLAALLTLTVLLWASQVVAGVTDRALQGEQPRLYLALAAAQLAVPLLQHWPVWPLLALLHCLLLGLLAYGLWRYVHDWMHSIFVEQRKIAYFAGGTLLYAALISFVHLTWETVPLAVPTGYYAPYLMAVCGLLFYLDAHFKEWVHQYTFLSRFSLLVYGLSVLAVVLALDAPLARLLTLALAAVIYGAVAWQYLTLVPLCLLLASLGGLYQQLILSYFPADQHFLWSLPGLTGIWALSRWAQKLATRRPGAYPFALWVYRLLLLLGSGLLGWSLYQARPGLVAMMSALVAAAAWWWLLQAAPGPLLGSVADTQSYLPQDLRNGPWLYAVILAVTAALAFAPVWNGSGGVLHFTLTLLLLSWLWTWLALIMQGARGPQQARVEVFANSALLSVLVGLGLALGFSLRGPAWDGALVLTFSMAALTTLWLSLGLQGRWLFYGFLLLLAMAGVLGKLTFFPGPSTGVVPLLAGLGVWSLLWWLDRQSDELAALRRSRIKRPLTLLWLFPLAELRDEGELSNWNRGGQEDTERFPVEGMVYIEGKDHG